MCRSSDMCIIFATGRVISVDAIDISLMELSGRSICSASMARKVWDED
jgi:hypothetical protein